MKLLSAIDTLSPLIGVAALVGVVSCVVSLVRAMGGRRKIPYVSVSLLVVPLVFFFLSRVAIVNILDEELANPEIRVTVSPPIANDPKPVLETAISNLYHLKGVSGTHPSGERYRFEVCFKGDCFVTTIAQDSDDSDVYWVSYEPVLGMSVPLGYTRLANEKI